MLVACELRWSRHDKIKTLLIRLIYSENGSLFIYMYGFSVSNKASELQLCYNILKLFSETVP